MHYSPTVGVKFVAFSLREFSLTSKTNHAVANTDLM